MNFGNSSSPQAKFIFADLDSKHASGIPSTVSLYLNQHNCVLLTDMHIDLEEYVVADGGRDQGTSVFLPPLRAFLTALEQQLKGEFFSDLEAGKSKRDGAEAKADDVRDDGRMGESSSKPKAKHKLQLKRKVDDDPFASDDEREEKPKAKLSKLPPKAISKPPSKAGGAAKRIREEP